MRVLPLARRSAGPFLLFSLSSLVLNACASGPPPMGAPAVPEPEPAPVEEPVAETVAPVAEMAPDPSLDTVQAGVFDNGKMWTFEYPPLDYLRETYGFSADQDWFRRAHLSALRIPGCTASFVSPNGLVMTNHHCARESIEQVSRDDEDLVADGFIAASLEDERPIEDYWADQLIEIRDVTDRVYAGLEGITGVEERAARRGEISEEITAEIVEELGGEDAGYNVEMVELYAGGRYSVYIFKRYTDVRLVVAPELAVAHFGGDPDNFTYPRYDLDVTFYRVYDEDGEPLESENFFRFSEEGVSEGDLTFVIGNPGSTSRLQTVAQLEYRRDVTDQALATLLRTRVAALQEYMRTHPAEARAMDLRNNIFSILNSLKAYDGMVAGLNDPIIMAKRKDHERKFQAAIDTDPALQAEYGSLISRMAELQDQKRAHAEATAAFMQVGHPRLASSTLLRAIFAFQYLNARDQGASQDVLAEIEGLLAGVPQQPREINEAQLTERFQDFIRYYGADHPFTEGILEGRTPEGLAAVIMADSDLVDSASAVAAINTGNVTMDDPAVRLVLPILQALGPEQQVQAVTATEEAEISSALGRAFFEVYGTDVPPDATFSLRIADGVVKDYEYNGTLAPIYTSYYGMYDHYYSYGAGSEWDLPERWLSPPAEFDLSTPINFVTTADIIGGNSGSPVIDRNQQVVGLIFDGNIESLPGDYIYLPEKNRAVAVDARGILEAIRDMYQVRRIVEELTTGALVGG